MEASNVKALREALCEIVLLTIKAGKSISYDVACGIIASKAKHALKQLPRNCDAVTLKEQNAQFERFCFTHRSIERCCTDCPLNSEPCCELAWAQLPYEGDKK